MISKADALAAKAGDLPVVNKQAHTYTCTLGAIRLDGYYTTGAKVEGQTLTLPIQEVNRETAGDIGTITVTIHSQNYEDMTATTGYGSGLLGPNDPITREQLAVMLWRYAGSPVATDKELHFTDVGKASGWALEALRWAVEKGIVNGKGGGILDPAGMATRAETAQMLKNFLESM